MTAWQVTIVLRMRRSVTDVLRDRLVDQLVDHRAGVSYAPPMLSIVLALDGVPHPLAAATAARRLVRESLTRHGIDSDVDGWTGLTVTAAQDYAVHAAREGGEWVATVMDLQGARTSADDLATLERRVRDMIVLRDELPDGSQAVLRLRWV